MYICVMRRQTEYNLSSISKFGEPEISRIADINNPEYKSQSISGLLALDKILGELSVEPDRLEIERKEGRPFFRKPCGVDFNISHSAELVCCALGEGAVGIDIEKISRDSKKNENVAKRFFTENEKALLHSATGDKDELFYRIWTSKEAMAKRLHEGLATSLAKDTVSAAQEGSAFFYSFALTFDGEKYIMTACADKSMGIEKILVDDGIDYKEY